jgi:hypothetical protein
MGRDGKYAYGEFGTGWCKMLCQCSNPRGRSAAAYVGSGVRFQGANANIVLVRGMLCL